MPIYEYQCRKCGQFELMQKITEPALTRCPTCQSKVTKLISSTSFQLKGSGWYVTDYARKDSKGKETSAESKSETKAETKADQGAAKTDTKTGKAKEAAAA
jgi:putative FmdB family regulatory protein